MKKNLLNEVYRTQQLMGVNKKIITEVSNPRAAIATEFFNAILKRGEKALAGELLSRIGKQFDENLIRAIERGGLDSQLSEIEIDNMFNIIKQLTQSSSTYKNLANQYLRNSVKTSIPIISNEIFADLASFMAKDENLTKQYYTKLISQLEQEYPGCSEDLIKEFEKRTGKSLSPNLENVVKSEYDAIPKFAQNYHMPIDTYRSSLQSLKEKVSKLNNYKFKPEDVQILNGPTNMFGRDVCEIQLPTGDKVIWYKSMGIGAPELKQAGDWQVIAGFTTRNDGTIWFVKDEATTQLTKGINPYLTEMDKFCKANGVESLGKKVATQSGESVAKKIGSGDVVSNNTFTDNMVNWSNVTNAKDMETYNKIIAQALKTQDYSKISRGGMENYGIPNFREWLMNNQSLERVASADDKTGEWFFTVK